MGSSQLFSNADVIIKSGVQGSEQPSDENNVNNIQKIVARGSVVVEFVENYHVEAGYDIVISKYALNTELMAGNKIFAGAKNSSNKSSIIGGSSCALLQLKAAVVGARSVGKNLGCFWLKIIKKKLAVVGKLFYNWQ